MDAAYGLRLTEQGKHTFGWQASCIVTVSMSRDFRNLEVFQMADAPLLDVLAILNTLEGPARFAICNQLARAALSVPLNLVEGCQRTTTAEYARFVEIAAGSAAETRYLLSVASRMAKAAQGLGALERDYERLAQRLQTLRVRLAVTAARERRCPRAERKP